MDIAINLQSSFWHYSRWDRSRSRENIRR